MECFSGKPSSFVPVSRRSLTISMRIKRLHERCTRRWPGMCAMLTALSLDCSYLILRMDLLPQAWWKPTPPPPASAPLLPYAPPGRGSDTSVQLGLSLLPVLPRVSPPVHMAFAQWLQFPLHGTRRMKDGHF